MRRFRKTHTVRNVSVVLLFSVMAFAGTSRTRHITGIAHAALRVSDISASLRFYGLLGFERAFEFTKDGQPSEEFLKINDRQFIELYPNKPDQHLGLMHVCFESDDLAALRRAYVEAGLNPPEIKRGGAGNDLFSLRRPDGAVLEFTQYQPGSMHMKDAGAHLGTDRLSERLAGVTEPVSDPRATLSFYEEHLGMDADNTAAFAVRIPSSSSVHLSFVAPAVPLRLVFPVASVEHVKEALAKRGIRSSEDGNEVVAKDPDGNEIRFVARP